MKVRLWKLCPVRSSIVLLKDKLMLLDHGDNNGPENIVPALHSREISLDYHEWWASAMCNSAPYHDGSTTRSVPLDAAMVGKPFTSSSVYSRSAVRAVQLEAWLVAKPHIPPSTSVLSCPIQAISAPGGSQPWTNIIWLARSKTKLWVCWSPSGDWSGCCGHLVYCWRFLLPRESDSSYGPGVYVCLVAALSHGAFHFWVDPGYILYLCT